MRTRSRGLVGGKPVAERHLSASQRAMIAAELATLRQGARTDLAHDCAMPDSEAATLLKVSERSGERAKEATQGLFGLSFDGPANIELHPVSVDTTLSKQEPRGAA